MKGAGCGEWTDADSAQALRPCTNMDVSKIKGEEGDVNTCKRCHGKVRLNKKKVTPKILSKSIARIPMESLVH